MSEQQLKPAVILVADRTLSGRYKVLFEGIFATMQTTQVPEIALRRFLSPPVATDPEGRAHAVPLGLRRIESALLKYTTLEAEDVVCTTPERIASLLGPWVKIVGFTSSDPLGRGMSNTTTTNFWKGELYSKHWTRQLLEQLGPHKDRYGFQIVVGGGGAWQWRMFPELAADLPVDIIFEGYFEDQGPALFAELLEGRSERNVLVESKTAVGRIQPIQGASLLGAMELSRGCGRGCQFCAMARTKMEHLPQDTILADLEANVAQGMRSVVSGSEDFFRYGATGIKPDFDRLRALLQEMQSIKGLSFMQIDHANVTSVLQLTDEQLREIRRLLTWERPTRYLWLNMGVESANGHLVAQNSPGKIAPFRPDDWSDLVREAADKMLRTGFFPVFSVILGLPGETPADVDATIKLVRDLGAKGGVIFPIFYEPIQAEELAADYRFTLKSMRADHLDLYQSCYEINFKRVPPLFWDNQRAGGVSWLKRATMQALGRTEVITWRRTFKQLRRQLRTQTNVLGEKEQAYAG